MTVPRALLFVLGVISVGLLTMALAKSINSVPIAWLIGYLTCSLVSFVDRRLFAAIADRNAERQDAEERLGPKDESGGAEGNRTENIA